MKIRIKKIQVPIKAVLSVPKEERCEVRGCIQRGICRWHPPTRQYIDRRVCVEHWSLHYTAENPFNFWEEFGVIKPKNFDEQLSEKPIRDNLNKGKPGWQDVLDKWLAKGKFPKPNFMNKKRWDYWYSIGGNKPEGSDGWKQRTQKTEVHPLLLHRMTAHQKTEKSKTIKIRRKR